MYTKIPRGLYRVGMWKRIFMGKGVLQNCIRWRMGLGERVRFWWDERIEGGAFSNKFPQSLLLPGIVMPFSRFCSWGQLKLMTNF